MTRRRRRAGFPGILAVFCLAAGAITATSAPASATVTCPTVDPSSGAVNPPPTAGVDWAGCDLKGANLSGADLAGAQLQNANLTQANMPNANLTNAALDGANLTGAVVGGDAAGATFTMATLDGTFLSSTDLQSANLSGAMALGAKLIGSDLKDADLENADFDSADLSDADLFGATLTGLSDNGTSWTNAICPNGASANFYTDGCLSQVAVSTPSATPTVTAGAAGNNGWYTSAVTVSWYWVDSNDLVTADCPTSTTSVGQGTNVAISASCTDTSANVGHASESFRIDTQPPVQTLTGFRNGATYMLGRGPLPGCVTTDALSGVALNGGTMILGGRPDGTGVFTVTCSNGQDEAGNVAATVSGHYTVVYEFGGFITPRVDSTLMASAARITVRFRLARIDGTSVPARTQAALATRHDVRATLRGPGISPVVSTCSWNTQGKFMVCPIATPPHVQVGKRYTITATENLGSGFVTIPIDPYSENPERITFRQ
jgi:Pentapeptide repeats (8 copies)